MARGRGRPPTAKRGRGRGRPRTIVPPSPPPADEEEEELQEDMEVPPPPAKKRRSGRPSKASIEELRIQREEEEINLQLEALQQQVLDEAEDDEPQSSGSGVQFSEMKKKKKRKHGSIGRPTKVETALAEEECEDDMTVQLPIMDEEQSCGLHMTTMQIKALASLVACKDCGESITLSVRPTTKGMISEFVVGCTVCEAKKVTITPNLVRERKRKREIKGLVLQKTENINYAHVAAFLDNGLGYSGLRHYCKYFNARCLNEATFIVYARQVIQDVVNDTEDNLQSNARIVRKIYDAGLDDILDITVSFTTTYHQWGSDFCLVAGAVIELQTGLVLDYDVANMYCHVCKINAKRIISMTPTEMTDWFNKHQSSCEIREWCDELDHDAEEGVKDIEPKYLECFVAKKIWSRSVEKFGFRYSTLIHESDETIHNELLRAAPYGDTLVMIDVLTNCFSRRKSEHARTAFQNKLKSKCPRERVQTKDRIMYVYAMSIPEYNRFAVGSNIKLRELVRRMEVEEAETEGFTLQVLDTIPTIHAHEVIPADGQTSEVVYNQAEEEEEEDNTPVETEEDEFLNIQREVERMEEETDMPEENEDMIEVEPSTSKKSKKVKTEIKRENIIMEALDDGTESGEYEVQTSVSDTVVTEDGGPSTSDHSPTTSQTIVVTESINLPIITSVSSMEVSAVSQIPAAAIAVFRAMPSTSSSTAVASSSSSSNNSSNFSGAPAAKSTANSVEISSGNTTSSISSISSSSSTTINNSSVNKSGALVSKPAVNRTITTISSNQSKHNTPTSNGQK